MTDMSETEKKRVAEQRETLGEGGLNSKRQRLEKATEDNEVTMNESNKLIAINIIKLSAFRRTYLTTYLI